MMYQPEQSPILDYSHRELYQIITDEMWAVEKSIHQLEMERMKGISPYVIIDLEIRRLKELLADLDECRRSLLKEST